MELLHLPEQANMALYGESIPHCKTVNKEQSHTFARRPERTACPFLIQIMEQRHVENQNRPTQWFPSTFRT